MAIQPDPDSISFMLWHFLRFLWRAILGTPALVSGNWPGVCALSLAGPAIRLIIKGKRQGFNSVIGEWKSLKDASHPSANRVGGYFRMVHGQNGVPRSYCLH